MSSKNSKPKIKVKLDESKSESEVFDESIYRENEKLESENSYESSHSDDLERVSEPNEEIKREFIPNFIEKKNKVDLSTEEAPLPMLKKYNSNFEDFSEIMEDIVLQKTKTSTVQILKPSLCDKD